MVRWNSKNSKGIAGNAAGLFFPLREPLGFDARELTPTLVLKITRTAAETRSFPRATTVMNDVAGVPVSAKTIERVVHDIGGELADRRAADPRSDQARALAPESPPQLAVLECDGGRIRTRQPEHGPGVHRAGEGWREDKNSCLIRALRTTSDDDPQPDPPDCFCNPKHAAKIAETEALSLAAPVLKKTVRRSNDDPESSDKPGAWRPQQLVRTVLSSVADSQVFGGQMAREAKRRRFFEAQAKVFLGDGLGWNWSIWKKHFGDFTPVLDFIHVLGYLFVAAKSVHTVAEDAWDQYLVWMRGCWRGDVAQVLEELRKGQRLWARPPPKPPKPTHARWSARQSPTWRTTNRGGTTPNTDAKGCR